jgi:hypothetical protein
MQRISPTGEAQKLPNATSCAETSGWSKSITANIACLLTILAVALDMPPE